MTLCRSNSFNSLFRNSECFQGLRLIAFWQQCQQRKPREFQCRYQETSTQSVLAPQNTETHEGKPSSQNRLNCGQEAPLGSEILYQHLLCKCFCSLRCVPSHGCEGLGWWNYIASTYTPAPLPAFSVLKFLSTWLNPRRLEPSVQEKYTFLAHIQYNDTIFFLSWISLPPTKEHYVLNRALQ